jgi:hypothetical protein
MAVEGPDLQEIKASSRLINLTKVLQTFLTSVLWQCPVGAAILFFSPAAFGQTVTLVDNTNPGLSPSMQIGDYFTLSITGTQPNQPVTLVFTFNGALRYRAASRTHSPMEALPQTDNKSRQTRGTGLRRGM